ncbi:hypothetical protein HOLleu_38713 [Holothuria leucospilota]|uniref:Uncharacterized protein n=1 Tax=Holothuria leucospilota TaxID=206669 RepID=A0A9Q1BCF8_HOLLE|nr:hypothetical protein HOLleu_38713 [Holothuria leucospilota]
METITKLGTYQERTCLNPADLNNVTERLHYRMKTIDEIISSRLSNAKVFQLWTKTADSGDEIRCRKFRTLNVQQPI